MVRSTPVVQAAKNATTTIPILMMGVGDPVRSGFVASLAHPGGNITGMSNMYSAGACRKKIGPAERNPSKDLTHRIFSLQSRSAS